MKKKEKLNQRSHTSGVYSIEHHFSRDLLTYKYLSITFTPGSHNQVLHSIEHRGALSGCLGSNLGASNMCNG